MCPKDIPLQDQLGMLRRKMGFSQVKHLFQWGGKK
jgi:fumarate reductase iron-sulfur subunit